MKTALGVLVAGLSVTSGARYECDVAQWEAVEDLIYNIDYDQRKQQGEIDDFNAELDALMLLAQGNNTCGDVEYHNADNAEYAVLIGGCENEIYSGSDYSTIGGGQHNWAYTNAELVAVGGGFHNIATGDWSAIIGGVKNKAYSNYALVLGGYLGKANSKFATVGGGSRNTVSGRHSVVMGMKASVTGDSALGLGFSGDDCYIRGDNTFGVCADQFIIEGEFGTMDLVDELNQRRQLDEVSKQVQEAEDENAALEKELRLKIEGLVGSGRLPVDAASSILAMMPSL